MLELLFCSFNLNGTLFLCLPPPSNVSPCHNKPWHHGSCGHVNQPGQHHLLPAVYLQPNKGVCLFVVAGVECCVYWERLFNSARCYQPPSLKRPIQHKESMEQKRKQEREDINVGVMGHLEIISNPSFPKEQRDTGHKGGSSQANVKSKHIVVLRCMQELFSGEGGGAALVFPEEPSIGGSCEVSFASANGWPVSPWQQAISTSLSAIIAAMAVCLSVCTLPPSIPPLWVSSAQQWQQQHPSTWLGP